MNNREIVGASWIAQGAAPAIDGQVENINPNNEDQVIGAIHAVIADPNDANNLWVGSTNGGVWKTTNATNISPNWTPLTDEFRGLSIGALEFDPTDTDPEGDGPTIIAGIGHASSYAQFGGPLTGLLFSTDGGDNFTSISPALLQRRNISGVAIRGNNIVVSANNFGGGIGAGVYRSTDGGDTWNFISGTNGLGTGASFDLVGDSTNLQRLYVSVSGVGIFRSDDNGANWTNVSDNDFSLNNSITGGGNNNTEMAVASNGRVYTAVLTNGQPSYIGFTDNPTAANPTWTEMDLPITLEGNGDFEGLSPRVKPGGQGAIHFSIIADPNNPNIVYIGGDRQDLPFPNSIGARDFTGRLFRGDTTQPANDPGSTTNTNSPQWQPLTHGPGSFSGGGTNNNSAPHADSREVVFDANGNLIEVDDGGIYRRTNPGTANGDWFSIIGNLQVTEQHDIAYDPISNIIISGNQDTGTTQQQSTGSLKWDSVSTADGGDVAVSVNPNNANQSVRYSSFQNLGTFRRRIYDSANNLVGNIGVNLNGFNFNDVQFNTPVVVNAVNPNRIVIGGDNNVYESFNQGDNVAVVNTTGGGNVGVNSLIGDPISYGANDNEEILYIGSFSDVFVRTTAGGDLVNTFYPGGTVRDIVFDLDNSATAFAIDDDQIFQTTDTGANWTDITGDLSSQLDFSFFGGDFLRSVEYIASPTLDAVVVGSTQGVFAALSDDWDDWFSVGETTLPNAPVWDMDADETDDLLVAGTLGRGAWLLSNIEDTLNSIPNPDANGPYNVNEGGTVSLDASSSNDPNGLALTYEWDLDDDGIFGETGTNAQRGNEIGINPIYSAVGLVAPTMVNVTLRVINSQGSSATTTATINVNEDVANDETLVGSINDDLLVTGAGNDLIIGLQGNDTIRSGAGNDTINGSEDDDEILGEAGADRIFGAEGNDDIDGGSEDDLILGGSGDDTIEGGLGNDQIFGEAGQDMLSGGDGNDFIIGREGNDNIMGGDGNDSVNAGIDDDVVSGGAGNDILFGLEGNDLILGGDGNDVIVANQGNDTIQGGDDNDTINGGEGDDLIDGREGSDRVFGADGNDTIIGFEGDDVLLGNNDNDLIQGNIGDDQLFGGLGMDTLLGQFGNDYLAGNEGNDSLNGGADNDSVIGGSGNDTLIGDAGEDLLIGQAGADTFVLQVNLGVDSILDFVSGVDSLELPGGIAFGDLTLNPNGIITAISFAGNNLAIVRGDTPVMGDFV